MIALVDYGAGNLRSVQKALRSVGASIRVANTPEEVLAAGKIVLPGVGAFGDGMAALEEAGMVAALQAARERGVPILGICLGMQLLFEESEELGEHRGFGWLPGKVRRFPSLTLKVPQTGWNQIWPQRKSSLLMGVEPGSFAYFNHSYYCDTHSDNVLARTEYGVHYATVVQSGKIFGVQFHPEKSQMVGLQILRNFVERCE